MRKAISLLVLLAFGNSLWANDNAQDVRDRDNQRPKIVVEKRHTATRTESYLLYMEDSYGDGWNGCLLYTSPSPRDRTRSRMPSSA